MKLGVIAQSLASRTAHLEAAVTHSKDSPKEGMSNIPSQTLLIHSL